MRHHQRCIKLSQGSEDPLTAHLPTLPAPLATLRAGLCPGPPCIQHSAVANMKEHSDLTITALRDTMLLFTLIRKCKCNQPFPKHTKLLSILDLKLITNQLSKKTLNSSGTLFTMRLNYCCIRMVIVSYTFSAHPISEFNYFAVFLVEIKLHVFRLI